VRAGEGEEGTKEERRGGKGGKRKEGEGRGEGESRWMGPKEAFGEHAYEHLLAVHTFLRKWATPW